MGAGGVPTEHTDYTEESEPEKNRDWRPWSDAAEGEAVVPRWEREGGGRRSEAAGGGGPRDDLRGRGADREGRAARSREVAAPVDHGDEAAGADDVAGGAEEGDGVFGVEDVEEQGGGAGGGREAEAVEEDVADGGADVGEAGGGGAGRGEGDHRGIEVEGMDGAADTRRERDRERAVAAAELGDVAGRGVGDEAEGVEDEGDVEEGFPVGLGGHAALAEFHGLRARR